MTLAVTYALRITTTYFDKKPHDEKPALQLMQDSIRKPVARLLAPLARLLLRHGVSHAQFSDWAKTAYITQAVSNFGVRNKKPSVSRIAIVTGINRKEVKRVLELPKESNNGKAKQNRATRVVTGWLQDSEFHDSKGNPLVLEFGMPENSFNQLVKRYGGDVPARAVLDELLRVGTVTRDGEKISMKQKGYVPHESEEQMLNIFGDSSSDLLETIDHNLSNDPANSRLQLNVVYDNLPQDCLPAFKKLAEKKSMELLQELDKYLVKQDRDANQSVEGTGTFRAGLGVYLIEQDLTDSDESEQSGVENEN